MTLRFLQERIEVWPCFRLMFVTEPQGSAPLLLPVVLHTVREPWWDPEDSCDNSFTFAVKLQNHLYLLQDVLCLDLGFRNLRIHILAAPQNDTGDARQRKCFIKLRKEGRFSCQPLIV